MGKQRKALQDLTLLDRFLFAELMEDPENSRQVLEIILGHEIQIADQNETEKEIRKAPWAKSIRLDVYTVDEEGTVYNSEMQKKWRNDLEKRSRYYQGLMDSVLLKVGTPDYKQLNDTYIIMIMPFDLYGEGKYQYTIRASCVEDPAIPVHDGATRIFLNTKGRNQEEVSPELIEFLNYVEKTNQLQEEAFESAKVRNLQRAVKQIKSNEQIGVKYMQEWEERLEEYEEALAKGRTEGRESGREQAYTEQILKKQVKGKSISQIAEELELTEEEVQRLLDKLSE